MLHIMKLHKIINICVIGILLEANLAAAEDPYDCRNVPNLNKAGQCCVLPVPSWTEYMSQCESFKGDETQRYPSPCMVDCIYNVSGSISGNKLNMDNVYKMLNVVYPNNQEAIDTMGQSLEKCVPILETKLQRYNMKNQRNPGMGKVHLKCSLVPFYYAICAYYHFGMSCPKSMWTPSEYCEKSREFVKNCGPYRQGGHPIRQSQRRNRKNRINLSH